MQKFNQTSLLSQQEQAFDDLALNRYFIQTFTTSQFYYKKWSNTDKNQNIISTESLQNQKIDASVLKGKMHCAWKIKSNCRWHLREISPSFFDRCEAFRPAAPSDNFVFCSIPGTQVPGFFSMLNKWSHGFYCVFLVAPSLDFMLEVKSSQNLMVRISPYGTLLNLEK